MNKNTNRSTFTLHTADGELSRREFMQCTGTIILGVGLGSCVVPGQALPPSDGYLLVDSRKCQGCLSCMLACSLVHEGAESLSLSRIQVLQSPLEGWPDTTSIQQCRQCVDPLCIAVCPVRALQADPHSGNVRVVDEEKCIGCGRCVDACPYVPSRIQLAPGHSGVTGKKCDLCANAPYHWDETGGGPGGKQACVEVCPVGAIRYTRNVPVQNGADGYEVNLRDKNWEKLGYPGY